MSMKLVVRIMHEVELPRGKQLVLMAMAENADDDGKGSRPSIDRIAWKANYKWRQVVTIMGELERDKIIEKVKEAAQHRAPEWDIHIGNAPQKMPFEEWRKVYGRYAGRQPRDAENAPLRGAESAPLEEEGEEAPEVQFSNPGVQKPEPGVQFDDARGATATAPEPLNQSNEPLNEPEGPPEPKKKASSARRDRSKPKAPDHRAKVEAFLEENGDLADEILEFIAREAAKNDSGEMTYGRQWRGFVLPVDLALKDGADRGAVLYALQEANRMSARDMRYFESVLENNPNGRPRRIQRPGPSPSAPGSVPPGEISGDRGAARRKEGYEWLFGDRPSTPDGDGEAKERQEAHEREREEAEAEHRRRLKLAETEMRRWRRELGDQGYQLHVLRLKNAAEENGIGVEDVERLDEEIRAEHAERIAG